MKSVHYIQYSALFPKRDNTSTTNTSTTDQHQQNQQQPSTAWQWHQQQQQQQHQWWQHQNWQRQQWQLWMGGFETMRGRTGPNNARCVIWALGTCFLISSCFLFTKWFFKNYIQALHTFEGTMRVGAGGDNHNGWHCDICHTNVAVWELCVTVVTMSHLCHPVTSTALVVTKYSLVWHYMCHTKPQ